MDRPLGSPPDAMLATPLERLGADIRAWLRARFPDLPPDVPLVWREGRSDSNHHVGVVQTDTEPPRGVFVKGPARRDRNSPQDHALEQHVLADIGPRIARRNPRVGCPALVASAPAQGILVLELIEGRTLDSMLFGFGRVRPPHGLAELVRLTGEWLGHFHVLTRTERSGNPLDWVLTELETRERGTVLSEHAGLRRYDELRRLAERFRRSCAALDRPRCLAHHTFTAWHVLVTERRLLVIDFASSREGYPHEDLGHFLAVDAIRAPWRRLLVRMRIAAQARTRVFLDGYQSIAGPLVEPDRLVLRFARVLAAARFTRSALNRRDTWAHSVKARFGVPWLRRCLAQVCRQELAALRDLASTPPARVAR